MADKRRVDAANVASYIPEGGVTFGMEEGYSVTVETMPRDDITNLALLTFARMGSKAETADIIKKAQKILDDLKKDGGLEKDAPTAEEIAKRVQSTFLKKPELAGLMQHSIRNPRSGQQAWDLASKVGDPTGAPDEKKLKAQTFPFDGTMQEQLNFVKQVNLSNLATKLGISGFPRNAVKQTIKVNGEELFSTIGLGTQDNSNAEAAGQVMESLPENSSMVALLAESGTAVSMISNFTGGFIADESNTGNLLQKMKDDGKLPKGMTADSVSAYSGRAYAQKPILYGKTALEQYVEGTIEEIQSSAERRLATVEQARMQGAIKPTTMDVLPSIIEEDEDKDEAEFEVKGVVNTDARGNPISMGDLQKLDSYRRGELRKTRDSERTYSKAPSSLQRGSSRLSKSMMEDVEAVEKRYLVALQSIGTPNNDNRTLAIALASYAKSKVTGNPIVMFCKSGKDRTGAEVNMITAIAMLDHQLKTKNPSQPLDLKNQNNMALLADNYRKIQQTGVRNFISGLNSEGAGVLKGGELLPKAFKKYYKSKGNNAGQKFLAELVVANAIGKQNKGWNASAKNAFMSKTGLGMYRVSLPLPYIELTFYIPGVSFISNLIKYGQPAVPDTGIGKVYRDGLTTLETIKTNYENRAKTLPILTAVSEEANHGLDAWEVDKDGKKDYLTTFKTIKTDYEANPDPGAGVEDSLLMRKSESAQSELEDFIPPHTEDEDSRATLKTERGSLSSELAEVKKMVESSQGREGALGGEVTTSLDQGVKAAQSVTDTSVKTLSDASTIMEKEMEASRQKVDDFDQENKRPPTNKEEREKNTTPSRGVGGL